MEDHEWAAFQSTKKRFAELREQWGCDTPADEAGDERLLNYMYGFRDVTPPKPLTLRQRVIRWFRQRGGF